MAFRHTIEASLPRTSGLSMPRLSRRAGFWAVAASFLAVAAFSTAPSSLYGLYEHREHLSSLTITFVYAVYAVGVVASLLLAGHVSDWYGRRAVLLPAIAVAIGAAVVFLIWRSLAGLDQSSRYARLLPLWNGSSRMPTTCAPTTGCPRTSRPGWSPGCAD